MLYDGKARIVDPYYFDATHLWAGCLHDGRIRSFRLDRIEAARPWHRIEDVGPDLGEPLEVNR